MRYVAAGFKAFRPFGPLWTILFVLTLFGTFGFGGGTGTSAPSLVIRFFLLGLLLTGLVVAVAFEIWENSKRS